MILVYTPDTGDEKRWDLAEVKVTFAEAKAAEKAGGFSWVNLEGEIQDGNVSALQAAVWVLRKRDETTLRFADLEDLPIDSVRAEFSPKERDYMRAAIENDDSMSQGEKDAALSILGFDGDESDPKAK